MPTSIWQTYVPIVALLTPVAPIWLQVRHFGDRIIIQTALDSVEGVTAPTLSGVVSATLLTEEINRVE